MKKFIGILITVLVVAGMAFMLISNRKQMQQQTSSTSEADRREAVQTIQVVSQSFSRDFTANGLSQAVSELNFVSDVSGRIVEIYVDKGDRVTKGKALLKIDTELYEADYKAAKAAYEALKKDEARFARSNKAGGVTDQQLDNIRTQLTAAESRMIASKWKYENAVVKSPMNGMVNSRFVEIGALIAPNAPLFEIVDNSSMKVTCNVPESRVGLLSVGQKVTATDSSLPGTVFTGSIRNIGIKTDRGLNYPVEIVLDDNDQIRIGMYLKVQFSDEEGSQGILIPRKAIVGSSKSADAYVVVDGKAERRALTLGAMIGDQVEVLDGLEAGDELVVAGIMNLGNGTPVRVVEK